MDACFYAHRYMCKDIYITLHVMISLPSRMLRKIKSRLWLKEIKLVVFHMWWRLISCKVTLTPEP
jgi:hypothetical protein